MSKSRPPTEPLRVRPARAFVLGLGALLLLVELLLTSTSSPREWSELHDAEDVRALLRELATPPADPHDSAERWLLLGDSVLVGNTGTAELPTWASHRLIDYMRSELSSEESVRFEQVALDGMIPADMLAVLEGLDRVDPKGEVSLLIELSPRHFSTSYMSEPALSRPWLAEVDLDPLSFDGALAQTRRLAPIYRHRDRFRGLRQALEPPESEVKGDALGGAEVDELSARLAGVARLSVHYRQSAFRNESVQIKALRSIVRRCRARGRRLVLFTTPLEDRFAASLRTEAEWGHWLGRLDRLLSPNGETIELLPMDHPMFASALFWDHVHLRPEGHRLLAINLLTQLGLRLERAPAPDELVARPGFDTSLVARVEPGSSNGAAWQARFDQPRGLALSPDGRRLVIADTKNHVLRQLHGDMRVVSTFVGAPGKAGSRDGGRLRARLRRPRAPLFVGEALYFADDRGRRLRHLAGGRVTTLAELDDEWRIRSMRASPRLDRLLTLESRRNEARGREDTRIVVRRLDGAELRVAVSAALESETRINSFTIGPAGEVYVATVKGEIWRVPAAAGAISLDSLHEVAELLFAKTEGAEVIPEGKGSYPRPFDEVRLSNIVDLVYVEPFGGLLVQDYAPHPKRGRYENHVTERAHLRFLDLERELVYPWIKPLVVGFGYAYFNKQTKGMASYFHEGSMALDPGSRTLYYLERARPRLLRIEDGIFNLTKVGSMSPKRRNYNSPIGEEIGADALAHYKPSPPLQPELGGPYELLVTGSSMTAMSQAVGDYSLARLIIARLERELILRDRVRVHGFQRSFAGGALHKQIARIERFLADGGRPDVLMVEVNSSVFLTEDQGEAEEDELLARLVELAGRYDSKIVFFDTSPYISRNREPLHAGPERMRRFLDKVEERSFAVIRVEDLVLDDALEVVPFGTPPLNALHPPPWAVDAMADALAAAALPIVREALRGRQPALARATVEATRVEASALADAFAELDIDWHAALPDLPMAALQYRNVGSELRAFIDLGAVPEGQREDIDALILACIHERSVRFGDGARTAKITIGEFTSYDEYGAGVEIGATVVASEAIDFDELRRRAVTFARERASRARGD